MKILKFTSDKCPPCKRFDLEFEQLKNKDDFEVITIKQPDDRFTKYNIKIIPFIIVLKDEIEFDRFHGSYFTHKIKEQNITKYD